MLSGKTLGVNQHDSELINRIVNLFPENDLDEISLKLRRAIKDIHTGHFIYLGAVWGQNSAAYTLQGHLITNQNLVCRQN